MWKLNWEETKQHFLDWWQRDGLVIGAWGAPLSNGPPHEKTTAPDPPSSLRDRYENGKRRAEWNHHILAQQTFPADILPVSDSLISPGDLALFLGSEPGFSKETVWFHPTMNEEEAPETLGPLTFDESNHWWQVLKETILAAAELGRGKYLVGCPDLMENIDILAVLRDPQVLLLDMIERPEWVEQKVQEINAAFFEAYQRIYDIIKLEDGSSAFGAFRVWGPGKTVKVQCDASAMFSPAMFERFVMPCLTEQCDWLDHTIYHLDGTHAMCHLDSLLSIDSLDAIEWTPQAGIEGGGDPRWYDLYRRILEGGKSIQAVGVAKEEIIPLLDAVGTKGVYIMTWFNNDQEAEALLGEVEKRHR